MDKATKTKAVEEFRINDKDCGSAPVQIAVLTGRISELTEHLKIHKKDHHTRRGLLAMVNRRRKLLSYLASESQAQYTDIIQRLSLRR
ncbi:MAG TPA: 30S ribosomal protein S15 [Lentisphaeria bacterium]|nr:30S ribosomal protein S15 [Lentisphaeria bacterium]|tara:strand:+ start:518 stop:781 length:264 start_codon:yes stop_codon:yes gene_type:complete